MDSADKRTLTASSWRDEKQTAAQRGYGYRWQKARETYLKKHPLCVFHLEQGQVVPATVVDHKVPHRGDMKLFWNRGNWQSLCKTCHDGVKARLENSGAMPGCGLDGVPLDAGHHWHAAK